MNKLVLVEQAAQALARHVAASAPLEEGAFCLLRQGRTATGSRLLATHVILPPRGAWERQGRDQLRPSAQWISAAISRAITERAGLLFVHSHPDERFPLGFSLADECAFVALARDLAPMLDGPFAAAIVHPEGWAGTVWVDGVLQPIDSVVSVGRTLRFLSPVSRSADAEMDARQRDALGVVHDRLHHLTVAVVGCGGLGSPIAEQLVRMGVAAVLLVDHDRLDTPSNVRRVFGSTAANLGAVVPPPKVEVVGKHLDQLGLGVRVQRVFGDVRTEPVFRAVLDADIVLNATDTHGSRAIVNELASTYLLPVIDVGVRVGSKANNLLTGLVAEVRILTPTTPCLWCRNTISADVIRAENLPEQERWKLEQEGYVVRGTGDPVPSVVALTVLGSGLATCALLALLSEEGEVAPTGYLVDGFLGDAFEVGPTSRLPECRCARLVGFGDNASVPFIAPDLVLA